MRLSLRTAYCVCSFQTQEHYASLEEIHKEIKGVDMLSELPEQNLIFQHIRPGANVLEFGGNIGRSSLVISKRLQGKGVHVVFEPDPGSAKLLKDNRDRHGLQFTIINAALSETRMAQKGWDSVPLSSNQPLPKGYFEIPTMTWKKFRQLHPYAFDTLVVDCEGCLDPILQHYPQILETIRLIILENDGSQPSINERIRSALRRKGFRSVHCGPHPTRSEITCFFEVWER